MMSEVLITGANGFLGSHLTDLCISKGFVVHALVKPGTLLDNLSQHKGSDKLMIHECDLTNNELLGEIIKDSRSGLIFHFGAQPHVIPSWKDPADTINVNVIGTINVFEPLKKYEINARVIIACSSAEYGSTAKLNRPLRESDPLLPLHPYGVSKVAAELLARQYFINFGIEVINLRFFNQTGPRKVNDACSDFVRAVARIELGLDEPVIRVGNLNSFRDITGVKDSVKAIWLAASKGVPGETYNVCSGRKIHVRSVLNTALSFSSKKIKVVEGSPVKLRKTDEDVIIGDNSKITALGFKVSQSINEFLKDMFDYWIKYYSDGLHAS